MLFRRILGLGILLAACLGEDGVADSAKSTPIELVKRAYGLRKIMLDSLGSSELEKGREAQRELLSLMSSSLREMWRRDRDYTDRTGTAGHLGSDPFLCGQDYESTLFTTLRVEQIMRKRERAEVRVRFVSFGPHEVRFELVLEAGQWVINDMHPDGVSVRELLQQPYERIGE